MPTYLCLHLGSVGAYALLVRGWLYPGSITSPDGFQYVALNVFIIYHQWQRFQSALGDEYSIKWSLWKGVIPKHEQHGKLILEEV